MVTTSNLLNRTPHGNGTSKNWQGVLNSALVWKLNIEGLLPLEDNQLQFEKAISKIKVTVSLHSGLKMVGYRAIVRKP